MPRGRKRAGRWTTRSELALVLAVLALPFADEWLGGRLWWITALATFHFYWLLPPAVVGLAILATRARRRHWPLALATAGLLIQYGPQMVPAPGVGTADPEPLTILTWNVQASAGDAEEIARVLREEDPGVIALQEVISPDLEANGLIDRLRDAGFSCEYRGYFVDHPNTGIGLCVRPPIEILQASRRTYHDAGAWSYLFTEVAVGDRVVNIVLPHFLAFRIKEEHPIRAASTILERFRETTRWHRQEAAALLDLLDRLRDPTFVVGDFNSTPWQSIHVALRRRLDDAFAEAGLGFGGTFRHFVPLRIDYVYVPRGVAVLESRVGPASSSDHRPVVATVDLSTLPR